MPEASTTDGRTARRDRNRLAVLDAVLELFSEDNLTPTPEQVAQRSGLSLRSVYRYVADRDDLIRAAIERHLDLIAPLFVIEGFAQGPLDQRIERFVGARIRLYEAIAATHRATRIRAPESELLRDGLDNGRRLMREQLERQFARELHGGEPARRRAVLAAADALTQIETIEHYRVHRRFSSTETEELLVAALAMLLGPTIDMKPDTT